MSYFKKSQRLSQSEFTTYFKHGRRFHSPALQLIYTPLPASFHGAVVVGKKVAKRAVVRNQLRRKVYAHLYHHTRRQKLTGVFIVVVKPSAKQSTPSDLTTQLDELIGRVGKNQ